MEHPSSPKSIGFLLSGPIGLAVADSAVISSAVRLGLEVFVTVGATPGLIENYEALTLQALSNQGISSLTELETKQKTDTLVCVGWRSMVATEGGLKMYLSSTTHCFPNSEDGTRSCQQSKWVLTELALLFFKQERNQTLDPLSCKRLST